MRNRFVMLDGKKTVKVVSVSPEGELTRFTKVNLHSNKKGRHHVPVTKDSKVLALTTNIAKNVAAFRVAQAKIKELESKEHKRIMSNIDNWFHRANKLATT